MNKVIIPEAEAGGGGGVFGCSTIVLNAAK
jgi:hypothetical protein